MISFKFLEIKKSNYISKFIPLKFGVRFAKILRIKRYLFLGKVSKLKGRLRKVTNRPLHSALCTLYSAQHTATIAFALYIIFLSYTVKYMSLWFSDINWISIWEKRRKYERKRKRKERHLPQSRRPTSPSWGSSPSVLHSLWSPFQLD